MVAREKGRGEGEIHAWNVFRLSSELFISFVLQNHSFSIHKEKTIGRLSNLFVKMLNVFIIPLVFLVSPLNSFTPY